MNAIQVERMALLKVDIAFITLFEDKKVNEKPEINHKSSKRKVD